MSLIEFPGLLLAMAATVAILRAGRLSWGRVIGLTALGAVAFVGLRLSIMTTVQATVTAIFVVVYALIATEWVNRTTVALVGAGVMLLARLVEQREAFHGTAEIAGIDWNTIFLLVSMMVIVNITRETGLFQWLAIKSAKLARGEPVAIIIVLSLVTAVTSAFLDNVTTVLLIAPVAMLVFEGLAVNPVPCLICVVLASNIGGTATLIGDPPNIMIGSAGQIGFLEFVRIDTPPVLILLALFALAIKFGLGRRVSATREQRQTVLAFDESKAITDPHLLRRCLLVIGLVMTGFCLHGALHLEPGSIALAGAALMLLLHREGPDEALRETEWPTIFFYIGLFIMVSALVRVGVVTLLGAAMLTVTQGNTFAMTMLMLWVSALTAAAVSNVPFVPVMVALVHGVAASMHPEATTFEAAAHAPDVYPLWWALSLGACFGGNFTLVGASANVITAGLSARAGYPITFWRFMKYGVPVTLVGLVISSVWLWWVFLR